MFGTKEIFMLYWVVKLKTVQPKMAQPSWYDPFVLQTEYMFADCLQFRVLNQPYYYYYHTMLVGNLPEDLMIEILMPEKGAVCCEFARLIKKSNFFELGKQIGDDFMRNRILSSTLSCNDVPAVFAKFKRFGVKSVFLCF